MKKQGIYICIEGTEGVGKTTQIKKLCAYLKKKNKSVVKTRDIGSPHLPMAVKLRKIMLDNKYNSQLTKTSREMISHGMRSIHLEKLVIPKLKDSDFVVQDRGFLSALAYGEACGNDIEFLKNLTNYSTKKSEINSDYGDLYDYLIVLKGDFKKGLSRATSSKKEFKTGDAMESLGNSFLDKVNQNFELYKKDFKNVFEINIDGKSKEEVFTEIKKIINI